MSYTKSAQIRNAIIGCIAVIFVAGAVWVLAHNSQRAMPQRMAGTSDGQTSSSDGEMTTPVPSDAGGAPTDPYAATANKVASKAYAMARENFYAEVRTLYFAADCGVMFSSDTVAGEQNIAPYLGALGRALYQQGLANQIIDTSISEGMKKAAIDGRAQASHPGACDYWKNHPDEVYALRQQVRDAYSDE